MRTLNLSKRERLDVITNGNNKVLSGRNEGKMMRDKLKLDLRDNDSKKYEIYIPDVFAVTASYFLECFGRSIRQLGKSGFNEKYQFQTKNEAVKENIIHGIDSALIIRMPF